VGERVVVVISGAEPNLAFVDALAQLHVTARRLGWDLEVRGASDELRALLDFLGLPELCR